MDYKTASKFINSALLSSKGRSLSALEITILRGSWSGKTYEQIANSSEYSFNYLIRDVGPRFWRLLTEVFGENVNKNNIQSVIVKLYQLSHPNISSAIAETPGSTRSKSQSDRNQPVRDWENAPARLSEFYGYRAELNTFKQWVADDNAHLINLWGMKGIGKTALMREFASQMQNRFEVVIWRSLANAPSFTSLVASLAGILDIDLDKEQKNLASLLLSKMRSHSCLILLDGVESILEPEQQAGTYRHGYEEYRDFFQLVGESEHQSCLVASSLESLGGIFQYAGELSPVHSYRLSGLSSTAADSFLASKQLTRQSATQRLIAYYQGNPAMLSLAVKVIGELFNNRVEEFLAQKSLVFGDIDRLLAASFARLSALEKEVLYWLASEENPVSLNEIQTRIPISIYPVELLETIESLNQRSAIETKKTDGGSYFILSPIMREFTVNQFITQMGSDLSLKDRRQGFKKSLTQAIVLNSAKQKVQLSNWLENRFELGWQSIETLFTRSNKSPVRLRSAFHLRDRQTIKRFKEINLDKNTSTRVLLLVAVTEEESALKICVQVQPQIEARVLPEQLEICLIDETDSIVAEARSGDRDNYMQLPYFYGEPKDKFIIRLNLASVSHDEEFSI